MKRLIVSADDFGLTQTINDGIAMALLEGIVTNPTLIPAGEAFDHAIELARKIGLTEAGAHLALTEVSPVLEPAKIPTIVVSGGKFHRHYGDLFLNMVLRKIDLDQIYAELHAQLARAVGSGIPITSLSSHEHIHLVPVLLDIFVELALEFKIPHIRCPQREPFIMPSNAIKAGKNIVLSYLGGNAKRVLKKSGILHTDFFLGLLDSGHLTEEALLKVIGSLEEGVTELVTHPGFVGPSVVDMYRFHLNCESELYALTGKRVGKALEERGVSLTKFGELGNLK